MAAYPRSAAAWCLLLAAAACSRFDSPEKSYQQLWATYVSGSFPKTIEGASREAAHWKDRPASPWYWKFHLLHAEALLGQGKSKEAAALLKDEVPSSPELAPLRLRRDVDLANALLQSDRPRATALLDHAEAGVRDPDLRIRIQFLRGVGLVGANDIEGAEQAFQAALARAAASGNAYREAGALNNLSYCARRRGEYEKAVDLATRAIAKAGQAHAAMVQAQAHNNLANYDLYLGNTGGASENLQQAVKLFSAVDARADLLLAWTLLGNLHYAEGDVNGAVDSYGRVYQLAVSLDRKADAAMAAANLAAALIKDHRWNEAADWNQKAAGRAGEAGAVPAEAYIARNRARIADWRGDVSESISACRYLLDDSQKNTSMRWEAYAILGGIDARARHFAKANQEFAAALTTIGGERSLLENPQNRITLLSRVIPFYQEYVESLVEQNDNAGALAVVESSRARVLAEALRRDTKPMAFDEAALKHLASTTRSSLISFWLAPQRSFAWLITPQEVHRFTLPGDAEIGSLIAAYRNTVEHSWGDPLSAHDAAAAKLWNAVLGEVAQHIPHGSRVIVIPDGALHRLNLETLPVPGPNPHYWLEDVDLAVAPSMTLLAMNARPRHSGTASLLVMGAPLAAPGFDPLPQAQGEVAEIQSRFPAASKAVFTGAAADLAAYRSVDPEKFSLIHFAAHAEPNPESPLESAIILSPSQGQYRLKARDIVGSKLTADLVTISACRSAGARVYAGEGLIGLAWAFLEAGSNAVIAGLWDVNDGSSRLLMDRLYAGIAAGKPPDAALHDAKIAMLQGDVRYRKPYFWGPFQAYLRSGN